MARLEVDARRAYVPSMFLPLVESSALQQLLSREVARAAQPIVHLIEHEVVRPLLACKTEDALKRPTKSVTPAHGEIYELDLTGFPELGSWEHARASWSPATSSTVAWTPLWSSR